MCTSSEVACFFFRIKGCRITSDSHSEFPIRNSRQVTGYLFLQGIDVAWHLVDVGVDDDRLVKRRRQRFRAYEV